MSYIPYKDKLQSLGPVAIKLGQHDISAPDHEHWGIVECDACPERFAIGFNRIYGSRSTDVQCAMQLQQLLANEHGRKELHCNSYQLNG